MISTKVKALLKLEARFILFHGLRHTLSSSKYSVLKKKYLSTINCSYVILMELQTEDSAWQQWSSYLLS